MMSNMKAFWNFFPYFYTFYRLTVGYINPVRIRSTDFSFPQTTVFFKSFVFVRNQFAAFAYFHNRIRLTLEEVLLDITCRYRQR